jgi:hypothetical protein
MRNRPDNMGVWQRRCCFKQSMRALRITTRTAGFLLGALVCLPCAPLVADEAADLENVSVEIEATMKKGKHREVYYAGLSKQVGVKVSVLEQQRVRSRLSYGEFYVAHVLAKESGRPFEVILAERRAKQGWGAIAKAHGVKLGPIVSAARKSSKGLKEGKVASVNKSPASSPKADRGSKPSAQGKKDPTPKSGSNGNRTRGTSSKGASGKGGGGKKK